MRIRALVAAGALCLALPASAEGGHFLLDHAPPAFTANAPLSSAVNSGGPGASWELITSFPTGNPHTDIDFFSQDGDLFVSAGTLAAGPNGAGQTIFKLMDDGSLAPSFVASHPSAACPSNPSAALGLQHDVEATPKGGTILNATNPYAATGDAELLIDASDANGRCHDQGLAGLVGTKQGGIEIIDITNPADPVEIGLVSNIGEAHTVNVDPKRPHIVYAVTSDRIPLNPDGSRQNEDPADADRFRLDGFEVIDISSCMGLGAATVVAKRMACRPEVFRYRYPTVDMALGHTIKDHVHGCHELEVYPSDLLTCGSGDTLIALDMRGAFDAMGTPNNFSDDRPNGAPLPCGVRTSSSLAGFTTGAMITDCVDRDANGTDDLTIPNWITADGAPSLEGVNYLGSIYHQGRSGTGALPPQDSTQDIDFNHEAELSESGNLLLATDERGGGVLPPGASCSPAVDHVNGNGGIHAYRSEALSADHPETAQEAFQAYARTPKGDKAIYRAPIRTQPQADLCTAHVFHQIPGQNRIFMGWYSQGTQVVDFIEHPNGRVSFQEAGYFIPENANTWISAVFDYTANPDGTFTYWGATGDFNLGTAGRSAVDIWKVTLPPPPKPASGELGALQTSKPKCKKKKKKRKGKKTADAAKKKKKKKRCGKKKKRKKKRP